MLDELQGALAQSMPVDTAPVPGEPAIVRDTGDDKITQTMEAEAYDRATHRAPNGQFSKLPTAAIVEPRLTFQRTMKRHLLTRQGSNEKRHRSTATSIRRHHLTQKLGSTGNLHRPTYSGSFRSASFRHSRRSASSDVVQSSWEN